jgi:hypothetical protein
VILHPPYLPDLATCDFFLFPKMKLRLKGRRLDTTEEIHAELQRLSTHIWELPGVHEIMGNTLRSLYTCIHVQGDYFEGDGGN